MNETKPKTMARLASLDQLIENVLPQFIMPVPSRETLRQWFEQAHVPRFKANPLARRGGGAVYYSVAAVEKLLRTRTLDGRLPVLPNPGVPTSNLAE
jgi:hypothetical protein